MKIYFSILNEGWVRTELAIKLPRWLDDARRNGHDIFYESSFLRPIEHNRNTIVKRFLASDCDYLLQIDNDNIPARNPLELVDLGLDVVSCPVWIYQDTLILNIYRKEEGSEYLVPVDYNSNKNKGLICIDATGTGVLLTSRRVLEALKAPFERKYDENGIEELGQDLYFSRKAKEAGFKIFSHFDYIAKHYKEINLELFANV